MKTILKFSSLTFLFCLSSQVNSAQNYSSVNTYYKPLFDFQYKNPGFALDEQQKQNKNGLLRFSILTGYREGIEPVKSLGNFEFFHNEKNKTSRFYMINLSILDMVSFGVVKSNRVILEVKDPSKYRFDPSLGSKQEWMRKNAKCFEYLIPYHTMKDSKFILEELSHHLGVTFGNEKRLVEVLVLVRRSKIENPQLQKHIRDKMIVDNSNTMSLDSLPTLIENLHLPPLIDETGHQNKDKISFRYTDTITLQNLKKELNKYDFDLIQEKRVIEMFVIKEKLNESRVISH